jgi:hypothetical protein
VKWHTLFDLKGIISMIVFMTKGKVHKVNIVDKLPIEASTIHIMDHRFLAYDLLYR